MPGLMEQRFCSPMSCSSTVSPTLSTRKYHPHHSFVTNTDDYSVLNPADDSFDRADIKPVADATGRLAFPSATPVSKLPFSVISYAGESETYTTPELLRTLQVIDVSALATATATATSDAGAATTPTGDVTPVVNGANTKVIAGGAGIFAILAAMMMI